jgi:hypothetical protein
MDDDRLNEALTALRDGALALWIEAREGVKTADPKEAERLHAAVATGRTHIVVTMALPAGAVRVGVAGEWDGERTLWTMTPQEPIFERDRVLN